MSRFFNQSENDVADIYRNRCYSNDRRSILVACLSIINNLAGIEKQQVEFTGICSLEVNLINSGKKILEPYKVEKNNLLLFAAAVVCAKHIAGDDLTKNMITELAKRSVNESYIAKEEIRGIISAQPAVSHPPV